MHKFIKTMVFLLISGFSNAEVTIKDGKYLDITAHFTAKGKKFTMRNTRPGDEQYYHQALKDLEVNKIYFENPKAGEFFAASSENRKKYYDHAMSKWEKKDPWTTYMIFNDQGQFVGWVTLQTGISQDVHEAGIAYLILPEFQQQGIASAATREVMEEIVLKNLVPTYQPAQGDIHIIATMVLASNKGSVKVLEKNGFVGSKDFELYGTQRRWYIRILPKTQKLEQNAASAA